MGFKLNTTNEFMRQVTVLQPGKDKTVQGTFTAVFIKIPTSEREQLTENDFTAVSRLLNRVVKSVDGVDVPEGVDALEAVLDDGPCRNALLKVYNDETIGVEQKNSRR